MNVVDAAFEVASPHVAVLGESPMWCGQRKTLHWVDVRGPALLALDGAKRPLPETVGGVVLAADGSLVLAMRTGLFRFEEGELEKYLEIEAPSLDNRQNDVKCDRDGRLWVGTMRDFGAATTGSLYCVERGDIRRVLTDVTIPNGPCWSPDGGTFYFADTADGRIRAYEYDGGLHNPRTLVELDVLPGRPDGATVDAEGFLWSARYGGGGIARIDPAGKVERFLRLPVSQVSSVMFGGDDLRTLYVTTSRQRMSEDALAREPLAGALLAVDAGVPGLPEPRYVF